MKKTNDKDMVEFIKNLQAWRESVIYNNRIKDERKLIKKKLLERLPDSYSPQFIHDTFKLLDQEQ